MAVEDSDVGVGTTVGRGGTDGDAAVVGATFSVGVTQFGVIVTRYGSEGVAVPQDAITNARRRNIFFRIIER